MGTRITNPTVDEMVNVQAVAEAAINASTRPVTEFGDPIISHMRCEITTSFFSVF